jgi:hypothetical protein
MNLKDFNLTREISFLKSNNIGAALDTMIQQAVEQRRTHERRWFENNYFDDGYHFKLISKKTGKTIDRLGGNGNYVERAIPRASRQIRGVSNLLFAAEPYPVVYPARCTTADYINPQTGQVDMQAYKQAVEKSKIIARKQGTWLTTEWEDEQDLDIKLINMMLKSAKNSISYLQVWSDTDKQKIHTEVYDAFDIILFGDKEELKHCPFITKTRSRTVQDIMADEAYKKANTERLQPDNRYATSEVKEAYMVQRYGTKTNDTKEGTIMEKETFIKEVLSEANWKEAVEKGSDTGSMEGKSRGDNIMRHVFSAGGVTLLDEYVNYDEYPFAEFRFEPGYLYQKPFIENFIPQNKSLDVIVTRLEKWINTMVVGVYQKRKGENYQVSNIPGGQVLEYETAPLQQMNMTSVGATPFNVIGLLDKYIEEQGSSTSALNQLPTGVKSGVAIESLKATEYANLKIATKMLKKTIRDIANLMLERADKDFLQPVEVEYMNDSEPEYFDVIGKRGYDLSQKVGKELPEDIVVIDKKAKVRIEIEPGLGLTMQGKREAMQQIITFMVQFAEAGKIPQEALNVIIKKFLETFGYGNTQEFMELLDSPETNIQDEQIDQIKLAVAEAMQDLGMVGQEADEKMVETTKLGVAEAMKDLGMTDSQKKESNNKVSISYKDLPPEGKVQAAEQAGIAIDPVSAATAGIV